MGRGTGEIPQVEPLLRWTGSKRAILSQLIAHCPARYDTYFEPFCGSASLFLSLAPRPAVLGDVNRELIACYRTLTRYSIIVYKTIQSLPPPETGYYDLRATDPRTLGSIERAARFIYLNRYCFNGVYRTNRAGHFNVPLGRNTGRIPPLVLFTGFGKAIRQSKLVAGDFTLTTADARRGDFVYLDPPYFADRPTYGEYGYSTFREADLRRLIDTALTLNRRGVKVLISYGGSADIRGQLTGFNATTVHARRSVAALSRHRRDSIDWILWNYDIKKDAYIARQGSDNDRDH
jgi:DNA adenine methylase